MKDILIIGASGHGKVIADIAKMNTYENIFFLDDDIKVQKCGVYPVVGKVSEFISFNCDMFVAIGNTNARRQIQREIERSGKHIVTLCHHNAVVADDVEIGNGTVVMAGAVINPGTVIGKGCIINTCSSIDHDCKIGNFVHVSVGSHLCGTVMVGDETWIGAGATVSNNVNICGDCMIGAGAVVIKDIMIPGTYIGVPARETDMNRFELVGGYCSTRIIEEYVLSVQHRRAV